MPPPWSKQGVRGLCSALDSHSALFPWSSPRELVFSWDGYGSTPSHFLCRVASPGVPREVRVDLPASHTEPHIFACQHHLHLTLLGCLPNPGRLPGAVGSLVQVFTRLPWMSQSFRSLDLVPKIHCRSPSDWWLRCRTIFVFLKFMINCFQASYVLFQGRRLFFFPFSIYMQWNVQILREQVHEFWAMTNVHPYITHTLMAQWVKSPPAMQETQEMWVRSLVQEDPPEKNMATCSSLLAWKIPCTGEPVGLQSKGSHRVVYNWATKRAHTSQDKERFRQPRRFLVPPLPGASCYSKCSGSLLIARTKRHACLRAQITEFETAHCYYRL